jgi:hypothetical protein
MRALSKEELEHLVIRGKNLSESQGRALFKWFEKEQPDLFDFIFGDPRYAIREENFDMSHLYVNLCFDVVYVYKTAFGKPLKTKRRDKWVDHALVLIDAEFKALSDDCPMEEALKKRLQDRLARRTLEGGIQTEFLRYFEDEVADYASLNEERQSAVNSTLNFLFIFLRLMDELYSRKKK